MQNDPPQIQRWHTEDIDEQSSLLTGWEQEYRQLSCGKFVGNVSTAHGPQIMIVGEHTNQTLHQSVVPPVGHIAFGLVLNRDDALEVNRHQVSTTSLLVLEGGREYDFRTAGDTELLGVTLERSLFDDAEGINQMLIQNALAKNVVPMESTATMMLRHLWLMLSQILRRGGDWPSSMPLPLLADTALNNILLALNLSGVEASVPPQPSIDRQARVVQQAIRYMREHLGQDFTIADVCAATHVSQRTLQYHFESCVRMSPLQYLKAMRLNAARALIRKLAATRADSLRPTSISEIATQCGYEHPSRFAGDYKRQFGALPSETLRDALEQALNSR
jgi:AraC family ethanolamine operon transcriptional activator